jgi:hypothetical protein
VVEEKRCGSISENVVEVAFEFCWSQRSCGGSEKVVVVDKNLPQLLPLTTTLT